MQYKLFDYINKNGRNEFKEWTEKQQKQQIAILNQKLDKLEQHGEDLVPGILTDSGTPGIKKLRAKGNVQLRPLLCKGPIDNKSEYTLLMGAKEIGGKWSPADAPKKADKKKQEVKKAPDKQRIKHERVN